MGCQDPHGTARGGRSRPFLVDFFARGKFPSNTEAIKREVLADHKSYSVLTSRKEVWLVNCMLIGLFHWRLSSRAILSWTRGETRRCSWSRRKFGGRQYDAASEKWIDTSGAWKKWHRKVSHQLSGVPLLYTMVVPAGEGNNVIRLAGIFYFVSLFDMKSKAKLYIR